MWSQLMRAQRLLSIIGCNMISDLCLIDRLARSKITLVLCVVDAERRLPPRFGLILSTFVRHVCNIAKNMSRWWVYVGPVFLLWVDGADEVFMNLGWRWKVIPSMWSIEWLLNLNCTTNTTIVGDSTKAKIKAMKLQRAAQDILEAAQEIVDCGTKIADC